MMRFPPCVGAQEHGALDRLRLRVLSRLASRRDAARLRDVRTFLLFVGYPRSGHTLFGALLDAHPNAVVSHELDAARYFALGYSYGQVTSLVLENARQFAAMERKWEGYSYEVPGGWQGRADPLLVIGDKKGGHTTMRLGRDLGLLDRIDRAVPAPVRFLHVVRNPFDIVATRRRRTGLDLDRLIEDTMGLFDAAAAIAGKAGEARVLTLRHEAIIADARGSLSAVARFLDLAPDPAWLDACAKVVFPSPNKARREVDWTPPRIERIRTTIARHPFLAGYDLES